MYYIDEYGIRRTIIKRTEVEIIPYKQTNDLKDRLREFARMVKKYPDILRVPAAMKAVIEEVSKDRIRSKEG